MMSTEQQDLPEKNNFYAAFKNVGKEKIKEALEKNGWHSRKTAWTDYELTNDWSELTLEGEEQEPLLNGAVIYLQTSIEVIDNTFKTLGGEFSYEFYDEDENLLLERKNYK